jgi:hypothetical protein
MSSRDDFHYTAYFCKEPQSNPYTGHNIRDSIIRGINFSGIEQ